MIRFLFVLIVLIVTASVQAETSPKPALTPKNYGLIIHYNESTPREYLVNIQRDGKSLMRIKPNGIVLWVTEEGKEIPIGSLPMKGNVPCNK